MMQESTQVMKELSEKNIPYQVFQHTGPVRSLEQAAQERDQVPEQVVRSILFRLSEEGYVMVLIAGPGQISWSALRKYLGRSRLTMASEDDVQRITGYPLGAVAPFGLPEHLRILVDESVLQDVSLGMDTLGFGHHASAGYRIADDFTIANTEFIDRITFYAYQTGSTTTSTISGVNLRMWDGSPDDPSSTVVFGDTLTNRLVGTTWSDI